jgi:hypothetical protein
MRRFFAVLFAVLAIGGSAACIASAGRNQGGNGQGTSQGSQGTSQGNQGHDTDG